MKNLDTNEWQYIVQAMLSITIKGNDAHAFVSLIDKLNHQVELSIKKDEKQDSK